MCEALTMLSPSVSSTLAQVNCDGSSSSAGIAHSTKFAQSSALAYWGSEFQKSWTAVTAAIAKLPHHSYDLCLVLDIGKYISYVKGYQIVRTIPGRRLVLQFQQVSEHCWEIPYPKCTVLLGADHWATMGLWECRDADTMLEGRMFASFWGFPLANWNCWRWSKFLWWWTLAFGTGRAGIQFWCKNERKKKTLATMPAITKN